jgi:hypothetical protein
MAFRILRLRPSPTQASWDERESLLAEMPIEGKRPLGAKAAHGFERTSLSDDGPGSTARVVCAMLGDPLLAHGTRIGSGPSSARARE